jgi:hypothetical protein
MSRPEAELAKGIVRILDHGVENLEPGARERLLAARNVALSRYREQPQPVHGLAWAGGIIGRLAEHRLYNARNLIALTVMVLALAGIAYWQSMGPANGLANDFAEIDMGLLTDELPINAYLDKGFDSWLKRSPR